MIKGVLNVDKFIDNPNLPQHKVSLGIMDGRVRNSVISNLENIGVNVIRTCRCEGLYDAVAYHPDMFMHHLGGDKIVVAPNAPLSFISKLKDYGFNIIIGEKVICSKYPYDIAYNVARIGKFAICNIKHTDTVLLRLLNNSGVKLIDVSQGYAKCSICIVDESVIITSDKGIFEILSKYNFDILNINPGNIILTGANYGFIGGASGLLSKNIIAFTGDVTKHPNYKEINEFLYKNGKDMRILDNQKLMDVGTFIPLKEYFIG